MAETETWRKRTQEEQAAPSEPKRRFQPQGSKVLHVRALPGYTTEQELVDIVKEYGECTKVLLLQEKNQAFVEMKDATMAADVLAGLEYSYPSIRNKRIYWQYSDRPEIDAKTAVVVSENRVVGEQASGDVGVTTVMLTISDVTIPVTLEAVHQIGVSFGHLLRIVTFNKENNFIALLEYNTPEEAAIARGALDTKDFYEGCCHIKATFSNKGALTVKQNDHRCWDFSLGPMPGQQMQMPYSQPMYYSYPSYDGSPYQQSLPGAQTFAGYAPGVGAMTTPMTSIAPMGAMAAPMAAPMTAPMAAPMGSMGAPLGVPPMNNPGMGMPSMMMMPMTGMPSYTPAAPFSYPNSMHMNMVDCFAAHVFQGTPVVVSSVERKLFEDMGLLRQLAREFNRIAVFVHQERSDFNVCWAAQEWEDGEDPHCLTVALAVGHSLLQGKATRSVSLLSRMGAHRQLTVREEMEGPLKFYWVSVPLSALDVFSEEPWFYETERPKGHGFLQGLKLEASGVVAVERNGRGVAVIEFKDEAAVLGFTARYLPAPPDKVTVLVATAPNPRNSPSDPFEACARVFTVDDASNLKEDYGGACAASALACFWFTRSKQVLLSFRNPSARPGHLRTKLLAIGAPCSAALPFDRVDVGGQCTTSVFGQFSL